MITKSELEKLYNSGLSLDKIAEREALSRAGVQYWMEKYNIPKRSKYEAGFYGYWGHSDECPLPKKLTVEDINELYFEGGLSAKDIAKLFNRTTGGIYRFMKKNGIDRRPANETNNIKYLKKEPTFTIKKNFNNQDKQLRIAGSMLYWAEGYKNLAKSVRGGMIDLANSDPQMIRTFLKFLREICGIKEDKLRVQLYCYANQDIEFLKKYWSELTGIPQNQFIKSYVREDFKIDKIGKMKHGLAHIRYADKKLFLQIKRWTEDYLKSINIE